MTQNKPLLPSYVDLPGMSQGLPPPRYQNLHSDTRPLPLAKHYGTHHQESSHNQTLYATARDAYPPDSAPTSGLPHYYPTPASYPEVQLRLL